MKLYALTWDGTLQHGLDSVPALYRTKKKAKSRASESPGIGLKVVAVRVTIIRPAKGGTNPMKPKPTKCPCCHGRGKRPTKVGDKFRSRRCIACNGTGKN